MEGAGFKDHFQSPSPHPSKFQNWVLPHNKYIFKRKHMDLWNMTKHSHFLCMCGKAKW